jgi:hypothetical protein
MQLHRFSEQRGRFLKTAAAELNSKRTLRYLAGGNIDSLLL